MSGRDYGFDIFARAFEFGYNVTEGIQTQNARTKLTKLRAANTAAEERKKQTLGQLSGQSNTGAIPDAPAAPAAPPMALETSGALPVPPASTSALPAAPTAPRAETIPTGGLPVVGIPSPSPSGQPAPAANALPAASSPAQPSGALPTEQDEESDAQFIEPAVDLAKIGGLIARGKYTDDEAKAIIGEFTGMANRVFAHYGGLAIAGFGTPVAAKAIQTALRGADPGSNVTARLAPDGNIVIVDPDEPDAPPTKMTREMLTLFTSQAAGGALDVVSMSKALHTLAINQQNADTNEARVEVADKVADTSAELGRGNLEDKQLSTYVDSMYKSGQLRALAGRLRLDEATLEQTIRKFHADESQRGVENKSKGAGAFDVGDALELMAAGTDAATNPILNDMEGRTRALAETAELMRIYPNMSLPQAINLGMSATLESPYGQQLTKGRSN